MLGASRGLGRSVASELAARAADVTLIARDAVELEHAAVAIRDDGGYARTFSCDVTRLEELTPEFAGTDLVVNCAAILGPVLPVTDTSAEDLRAVLDSNVVGALAALRAFLPILSERRGRHVAVSSHSAIVATAGLGAYCASKAAFELLHRVAALEASEATVVLVRPGAVETRMQAALREGDSLLARSATAASASGRVHDPRRVATELLDRALVASHGETIECDP